jgi:hypothetical protein
MQSMEVLLLPALVTALDQSSSSNEQIFEYFEQFMSIISYLSYHGDSISPAMWTLCGPLLGALSGWAGDFIREISIPLHNYLSKGLPQFLQGSFNGQSWVEILLGCIKTNFDVNVTEGDGQVSHVDIYEPDVMVSATLLTAFLTNAKMSTPNAIDSILPSIVSLVFNRLQL